MQSSEPTDTANSWRDPVTGERVVNASAWTGVDPVDWRLRPEELQGRFAIGQSRLGRFASIATGIFLLAGSLIAVAAAVALAAAIVVDLSHGASVRHVLARGNLWGFAPPFLAIAGAAGCILGGWVLWIVGRLGLQDGPALVLDDIGLEDRRTRRGRIAWADITEVRDVSLHSRGPDLEMLMIRVNQRGSSSASRTRNVASKFRILVQPLAIDAARLTRIIEARRGAANDGPGETSG